MNNRTKLDTRDSDGQRFRLVESSALEVLHDGEPVAGPFLWLFTDQVTGEHLGRPTHAALHLSVRNVREIIGTLEWWLVAHGEAAE